MTRHLALALAATPLLAGCFGGPDRPFDALPEAEPIPAIVADRVPASVPPEDIRVRGGCYYFILSGQEFPVELAPGQPYCENRPTT